VFRLSSSGVRGVRGKPLGSVSEYTCAGPAGERARTEVAGVRPDPSDATLTAVTRGRSVGGDCVGPGPAPGVRGAGGGNPVCGAAR
jgi:hypothetical protein